MNLYLAVVEVHNFFASGSIADRLSLLLFLPIYALMNISKG